jgi:hypothetical protein
MKTPTRHGPEYGTPEWAAYRDAVSALLPIDSAEKAAEYRQVLFDNGLIPSTKVVLC